MRKIQKKYSAKFEKIYAITQYLYPENLYGDIDILFGKMKSAISKTNVKPTKFYIEIVAENYMDEEESQILNYSLAMESGVTPHNAIEKMINFLNNKMESSSNICTGCEIKEAKVDFNKELKEKIAKNLSNDIEFCKQMHLLDKNYVTNLLDDREKEVKKHIEAGAKKCDEMTATLIKDTARINKEIDTARINKEMEQLSFKFMENEEVQQ